MSKGEAKKEDDIKSIQGYFQSDKGREKVVDVLQGTFEHYHDVALDHHTKAGTTSNILLVLVGAVLVLIGSDDKVCDSFIDIWGAVAIIALGIFGVVWSLKQHERYQYWKFIAERYQEELVSILASSFYKKRSDYDEYAMGEAKKKFPILGWFLTEKGVLKDRRLWALLHVFVIFLGGILFYLASLSCKS